MQFANHDIPSNNVPRPFRNGSFYRVAHLAGFDGLRLLAALGVIFSHAFVIATGLNTKGSPTMWEEVAYRMGDYGVFTFFIISGFLLSRSLLANPDSIVYAVNRILRLLPAFVFYSLVMGLLIGPVLSSLEPAHYFTNDKIFAFFRWGLDSLTSPSLPGMFEDDGGQAGVVNGSLWSLHYEALSYLFLIALWTIFRGPARVAIAMAGVAILTASSTTAAHQIQSIAFTLPYFAGGVMMNVIYRTYGVNWLGAAISVIAFVISCFFGVQALAFSVLGAYLVVFVGDRPNFLTKPTAKIGDLSYGLYLFGWPVEQAIRQVTSTTSPMTIFWIAVPATAVFAFLSCHLVERPAMRLRRPVGRNINAGLQRLLTRTGRSRNAAVWGGTVTYVTLALVILASGWQWWFVLESVVKVVLVAAAGSLIAYILHRIARGGQSNRPPYVDVAYSGE